MKFDEGKSYQKKIKEFVGSFGTWMDDKQSRMIIKVEEGLGNTSESWRWIVIPAKAGEGWN